MMKHFTVALLTACVLAAPAHASFTMGEHDYPGQEQQLQPLSFNAEGGPCAFMYAVPVDGPPEGSSAYGFRFLPAMPADTRQWWFRKSGPVVLHKCSGFGVTWPGPIFGNYFYVWKQQDALTRFGAKPTLPGAIQMTGRKANYFHGYFAGPPGKIILRAFANGREIAKSKVLQLTTRGQYLEVKSSNGADIIDKIEITAPAGSPQPAWLAADGFLRRWSGCQVVGDGPC